MNGSCHCERGVSGRNCTLTLNRLFEVLGPCRSSVAARSSGALLPGCENGSGRGRVHIMASLASRWKELSYLERDRAYGKAFHERSLGVREC